MMLDFNHGNPTAALNSLVDRALAAERRAEPRRDYLGGSRIGHPCERALQFELFGTPRDPGKEISGRTARIFEVGHVLEDLCAFWLRKAGFDLRTEKPGGGQYGFSAAKGRIRGHVDGVILGGPDVLAYPCLWEHKTMSGRSWRATAKHRVRKAHPEYFAQLQVYMAYMDLGEHPALFTATNKDTQELYFERVAYDAAEAQRLSDKAVRILAASDAGDILPRLSNSPDWHECKWCGWHDWCWSLEV